MEDIKKVQKNILQWYSEHGRDLPWRRTQNPYAIHVSEVMLQQTQVDRVIPYFLTWMEKWPSYEALAGAEKTELLAHWSGLGFNSRVLRLQKCAQEIVANGGLMKSIGWQCVCEESESMRFRENIMKLPGIGPYTSAAILAFAWNMDVPVVDTNIRRVLIFLFKLDEDISDKELEKFAMSVIPKGFSRDWHNALMDYGAMHLTARKTGIRPKSKQSKFEGSDRQVRGWILKQLVKKGTTNRYLSISDIQEEFPKKDVKKIIQTMLDDGLIQSKGNTVCI